MQLNQNKTKQNKTNQNQKYNKPNKNDNEKKQDNDEPSKERHRGSMHAIVDHCTAVNFECAEKPNCLCSNFSDCVTLRVVYMTSFVGNN